MYIVSRNISIPVFEYPVWRGTVGTADRAIADHDHLVCEFTVVCVAQVVVVHTSAVELKVIVAMYKCNFHGNQ